jgi:hypothetical protein
MSDLSDNARDLAETLCGSDFRHGNGILSRWEGMGELGEVETIRYDAGALRRLAAAALELAGETPTFDAIPNKAQDGQILDYRLSNSIDVGLWLYKGYKPSVLLRSDHDADDRNLSVDECVELAAILMHAAATAREWEGEKL